MRRALVALIATTLVLVGTVAPVGAIEAGGPADGGVYASVVVPGHQAPGRSYPDCNWEGVWHESFFASIIRRIRDAVRAAAAAVVPGYHGDPPADRIAKLVLDIDAGESNLFLDGRLAEILGRDGSFQVSYEGRDVTMSHQMVARLIGAVEVGRFHLNTGSTRDFYHANASFPEIQRGTYETGSGPDDLWWDPFYITVDDPGPDGDDCAPGLFYAPRNSDPRALIPDLQDLMHDLLNPVVVDVAPLDRNDGWAYVQVPTNFAVTEASLEQAQATAEVFDPTTGASVWAQATAIPTHLVFDPGDGSDPVRCRITDGRAAYDPADPGNCSHTYLHSSNTEPGGTYPAVLAVEWKGVFDSTSSGVSALFPIEPTYLEFDLAVGEARSSVAYNG